MGRRRECVWACVCVYICGVRVKVAQLGLTLCDPMEYTIHESESCSVGSDSLWPHGVYNPWNSPGHNTGMGSVSLLQGIFPTQGSNHITGGFLPAESQGKPKNTGVGKLSLLQRIFLTQEVNWDLLNCRWILYQLSYQGSPMWREVAL